MSVGPFYLLYLKPNWMLIAKPAAIEADTLGHPEFWRSLCVEFLAPHYAIKSERRIKALSELCYAMPRGRCAMLLQKRSTAPKKWAIYNGGDFSAWIRIKAQNQIIRAFGLESENKLGNVAFVSDEHEVMQADDQLRIQRIIGPVPYGRIQTNEKG